VVKIKKKVLYYSILLIIILAVSGCAPAKFSSEFNGYLSGVYTSSNKAKNNTLPVSATEFFLQNNITQNQVLDMPDENYLVLFYKNGASPDEIGFAEILTKYLKMQGHFKVYIVKSDYIQLDFISRYKTEYKIQRIWFTPDSVTELPFKKN